MDPVLLFFIGVAGFVLFRLFSVLGSRTGHEARPDFDAPARRHADRSSETDQNDADRNAEAEDDAAAPVRPVSTNARVLREADPSFDESDYLEGARGAPTK
jgi:predicted lipid-binding transport protein (Tim44 family)